MNVLREYIARKLHFLSMWIMPDPDEKPLPGESLSEYFDRLLANERKLLDEEENRLRVVK